MFKAWNHKNVNNLLITSYFNDTEVDSYVVLINALTRGGLILVDSAQIRILIVLSILFRNFYVLPKLKANRDGAGQKCAAGIFLKFGTITISPHSSDLLR